jgi:hypothetical protein
MSAVLSLARSFSTLVLGSSERAQALMLAAFILPVLVGMSGMAIDIGSYSSDRRSLQNAADSIALAAAHELPDAAAAVAAGNAYATRNGISTANVSITISTGNTSARAVVSENHNFIFIKALGIHSKSVSASATAGRASYGGGAGIVPWSVDDDVADNAELGETVVVKFDSDTKGNGNYGSIRIDGSGSKDYENGVKYGTTNVVCAVGTPNCTTDDCPGASLDACAENAPSCDGPECNSEPGVAIGPTEDGVDFRIDYTSESCDEFDEVFSDADGDGTYTMEYECNPWLDGPGSCPTKTTVCSRRIIIVPVVDDLGNGSSEPAEIQRFALMFLDGYDDKKCSGTSCEIEARFVKADVNARGLAGSYDPEAAIQFVRLSE